MSALFALVPLAVLVLVVLGGVGLAGAQTFFGVIVPYAAVVIFVIGFVYRIIKWASSAVPFHIPAVAGQEKSLPWIKDSRVESPSSTAGVVVRMALEVLLFRSLFRNDRMELKRSEKLVYSSKKYLWLGGLAFHWSLLLILFRHLRFFTEPIPGAVLFVQKFDGFFQVALPTVFITDIIILIALTYLIGRRLGSRHVSYISLPSDFLALYLVGAVVVSGVLNLLVFRVDVIAVKELAMGVISLNPVVPAGLTLPFYVHLFLACSLLAYFPFSKLMHGPGVLFSPTRNLQNNSRRVRHVNPWSYPVKVHSYEEWEDDYRDAMKKVGLPVERE